MIDKRPTIDYHICNNDEEATVVSTFSEAGR